MPRRRRGRSHAALKLLRRVEWEQRQSRAPLSERANNWLNQAAVLMAAGDHSGALQQGGGEGGRRVPQAAGSQREAGHGAGEI
eukprot:COSAG01_NODE_5595_length_4158_cov_12.029598_3_plen_83_part_00